MDYSQYIIKSPSIQDVIQSCISKIGWGLKCEDINFIPYQIINISDNFSKCSFEVFYRQWYTFCMSLRKKFIPYDEYISYLHYITQSIVPKLCAIIYPFFHINPNNHHLHSKCINDVMLYPFSMIKSIADYQIKFPIIPFEKSIYIKNLSINLFKLFWLTKIFNNDIALYILSL
mgnify:FL=1